MNAQYIQGSAWYWSSLLSEPTWSDSLFLALALEGSFPHRACKTLMRQLCLMGTELQRTLDQEDARSNLAATQVETLARSSKVLQVYNIALNTV